MEKINIEEEDIKEEQTEKTSLTKNQKKKLRKKLAKQNKKENPEKNNDEDEDEFLNKLIAKNKLNEKNECKEEFYNEITNINKYQIEENKNFISRELIHEKLRILGNWKDENNIDFKNTKCKWKQTFPPCNPVKEQYNEFPIYHELKQPNDITNRQSSEEKREKEKINQSDQNSLRKAAEAHRQTRRYIQSIIEPGMSMTQICEQIEKTSRHLIGGHSLEQGWAFPTGVSLNNCAAHWSPNPGDKRILKYEDVCKVDFGIHVNGLIIDCAFTVAFDPKYDNLLEGVREATNAGLKASGIDVRLCDVGAAVSEVMTSYEVEINQKMHRIKPIKNLNGHTIGRYKIHAGKSVPFQDNKDQTKMEEYEQYGIETFGSIIGKGSIHDDIDCSHQMKDFDIDRVSLRNGAAKKLLSVIDKNFSTLCFCKRWLNDLGETKQALPLKNLVDNNVINAYPPLSDIEGSYVAQFEHTLLLKPTCKEILSRGDDQ